jgi:hypothetical protein
MGICSIACLKTDSDEEGLTLGNLVLPNGVIRWNADFLSFGYPSAMFLVNLYEVNCYSMWGGIVVCRKDGEHWSVSSEG